MIKALLRNHTSESHRSTHETTLCSRPRAAAGSGHGERRAPCRGPLSAPARCTWRALRLLATCQAAAIEAFAFPDGLGILPRCRGVAGHLFDEMLLIVRVRVGLARVRHHLRAMVSCESVVLCCLLFLTNGRLS